MTAPLRRCFGMLTAAWGQEAGALALADTADGLGRAAMDIREASALSQLGKLNQSNMAHYTSIHPQALSP